MPESSFLPMPLASMCVEFRKSFEKKMKRRCCSGWDAWSLDDDRGRMRGCVMCHSPHATVQQTLTTEESESVHSVHSTHVTLSTLNATAHPAARVEFAWLQTAMPTQDKVKMLLDREPPRCGTDEQLLADAPHAPHAASPVRSRVSLPPSPSGGSEALSIPSDVSRCFKRKR